MNNKSVFGLTLGTTSFGAPEYLITYSIDAAFPREHYRALRILLAHESISLSEVSLKVP